MQRVCTSSHRPNSRYETSEEFIPIRVAPALEEQLPAHLPQVSGRHTYGKNDFSMNHEHDFR